MKQKTIVVAYNKNFVIGDSSGKIPWHIPDDLKFFKEITMGKACVMGRKTWDSIPEKYKPLPGRQNIIVTRNPEKVNVINDSVHVVQTIEAAFSKAEELQKQVCVVGGGEIYNYCLENNLIDCVIASEIHGYIHIDASVFFPDIKSKGWMGTMLRKYKDFDVFKYLKNV